MSAVPGTPNRELRSSDLAAVREQLGREAFVERVWQWRAKYGGTIIEQFKRLGATVDYEDERFTLDERYVQAVMKVFVDLYDKGLIYRDHYLVNWDPGLRSAISDVEVEDREVTDELFHIAYPLADGDGDVVEVPAVDVEPAPGAGVVVGAASSSEQAPTTTVAARARKARRERSGTCGGVGGERAEADVVGEVGAVDLDGAGGDRVEARHAMHQRGLA